MSDKQIENPDASADSVDESRRKPATTRLRSVARKGRVCGDDPGLRIAPPPTARPVAARPMQRCCCAARCCDTLRHRRR